MAYRNGTYVAFAADGTEDFTKTDMKYYNLMKGWNSMKNRDFSFINPHEKGTTIRPWSMDETIKRTLRARLDGSTRMILLIGNTTRLDTDFVPYEIEYAIDTCKIPIIACYVTERKRITGSIQQPLINLIPKTLKDRMDNNTVKTIHVPFRERIISHAIDLFNHNAQPTFSFGIFNDSQYDKIYKPSEI